MYVVFSTVEFDEDLDKLDNSIQIQIKEKIKQLRENPYVGKPLSYSFFREKKVLNYRFYYLIYDEDIVVLLVAISDKKDQSCVIERIKNMLPIYKEEIKKRIKNQTLSSA